MDRLREWFDNLLDKFFSGLVRFGSNAPWIVWLLRILLLVGLCTRWSGFSCASSAARALRLVPEIEPAPGAPSAREWQLWLRDAQAMAAQGQWREAIHFCYWASISRLGIEAVVAGRPRAHSARISCPAGGNRSAQIQPDRPHAEL
jgi:hypothetical protein